MPIPWQKFAAEKLRYQFDFTARAGGIALVAPAGVNASGDVGVSQVEIAGNFVRFTLEGGTAGNQESVSCIVGLEDGEILEAKSLIDIL